MQQPIISIGTGNFYYWNLSLVQKLQYLQDISGISGIEISCVSPGTKFSSEEILLLSKYSHNTIHLWKFDASDRDWMTYCRKTIPNFRHFVIHPNEAIFDDIDSDIVEYLSFENMDPRKNAYQKAEEMRKLFLRFPRAKFTFDINHADENNISRTQFYILQQPSQIHFSTVNDNFYSEFPEIESSHALAYLNPDFDRDIRLFVSTDTIITLEWVFPPNNKLFIENEIAFIQTLQ